MWRAIAHLAIAKIVRQLACGATAGNSPLWDGSPSMPDNDMPGVTLYPMGPGFGDKVSLFKIGRDRFALERAPSGNGARAGIIR